MYKCFDCGALFEEPKEYSEDRTPGGVCEGGSFIEHYSGCPYCSGAYDEAVECDVCGEFCYSRSISYDENGSVCDKCLEELEETECEEDD